MTNTPEMDHNRRLEIVALARQVAEAAKPLSERWHALEEVAWAYAELGMSADALEVANLIRDGEVRETALGYVCGCFVRLENRDAAVDLAKRMKHPEQCAQAWVRIAGPSRDEVISRNAMEAIEKIDHEYDQTCQMIALAEATHDPGLFDRAMALTDEIESDSLLSEALYKIAEGQIECGMLPEARKTAGVMLHNDGDDVLCELSQIYAESGDLDIALEIARDTSGLLARVSALIELQPSLPDAGLLSEARNIVTRSSSEYRYVEACVLLATKLNDSELISNALAVAEETDYEPDRSGGFGEIATAQAQMGMIDGAMETLGRIEGLSRRISHMAYVGGETRKVEFVNAALALADSLPEGHSEEVNYSPIVDAFARCGEINKAFVVAQREQFLIHQSFAMRTIVSEQLERGRIEDALETAAAIKRDWGRVTAYLEIAEFQDICS